MRQRSAGDRMTSSRSTGDGFPADQARTARALVASACDVALTIDARDRVVDVEASLDEFVEAVAEGGGDTDEADALADAQGLTLQLDADKEGALVSSFTSSRSQEELLLVLELRTLVAVRVPPLQRSRPSCVVLGNCIAAVLSGQHSVA